MGTGTYNSSRESIVRLNREMIRSHVSPVFCNRGNVVLLETFVSLRSERRNGGVYTYNLIPVIAVTRLACLRPGWRPGCGGVWVCEVVGRDGVPG